MDELAFDKVLPNSSQDATTATIAKTALPGLIPSSDNSPGSLLVGIILAFLNQNSGLLECDSGEPIFDDSQENLIWDIGDVYADIYTIYWQFVYLSRNNQIYGQHKIVVFSYTPS